jgi:hypothetical protein
VIQRTADIEIEYADVLKHARRKRERRAMLPQIARRALASSHSNADGGAFK